MRVEGERQKEREGKRGTENDSQRMRVREGREDERLRDRERARDFERDGEK